MATPTPRLISCDEAGFTGPKLLDEDQTIFSYASVDLSAEEGQALADELRATYKVQSPELKAGLLQAQKLDRHCRGRGGSARGAAPW